jgi:hypothetical protein
MVIDTKKPEACEAHQELFDFARAYLSEAFPNPERAGCPLDHVLRSFARNPRQAARSIADHISCCSPCFNAYTAHLEQARAEAKQWRQTTRAAWTRWCLVVASVAMGLLIVVYAWLMKPPNEPSATHAPPAPPSRPASSGQAPVVASRVLLDLTTAAPERGLPRSQTPLPSIPAEPRVDLTLRLPLGSEAGMYSVSLTSRRRTEWSSAARAHIEDGEPVLNMRGDFSHVPGGTYELVVASPGQHLRLPLVIARPPDQQR